MRRPLAVFALSVIVVIATAPAAPGAPLSCPLADPPFTHWIDAAAPSAFNGLGLFRRHARGSDRIPVRDPKTSPRTVGLVWLSTAYVRGIRRVRTSLPGGPYYAVPGVLRDLATNCSTGRLGFEIVGLGPDSRIPVGAVALADLRRGGVGTAQWGGGPTFVGGAVPDGVVSLVARYRYRDARRVVGRVSDNLVWWRLAHHSAPSSFPSSITWIGRGGKVLKVIHIRR